MLKNFQKVVEFRYKFAPPGCSPWQARNIDRLVVISFLRLMRPKGRLCSAVEGTPKGVQMCYASATQSVFLAIMSPTMFQITIRKRRIFHTVDKHFRGCKIPCRINSVRP